LDNVRDGRGIAVVDVNNDGRLDMFVTNANSKPNLYLNVSSSKNNFLELKLTGTSSNRDAIGARVTLRAGDSSQIREVNCGNGYAAQSSLRVHFGLGESTQADRIEVRWPSGTVQVLEKVKANQFLSISEPAAH
jgi:hypothetical protein